MTIDEIFDAMPAEAPATGRAYLIIDPQTRAITVPESEAIFGVEADANAARKYFLCPRYVGDNLDLASMFLTVNYRNANGDEDGHLVNDLQITDNYVTFSWPLSPKAVAYMGPVQFAVCADLPNSSHRRGPDWNTTLAQGEVLEGLDPDRGDVEGETSDVVTQLRAEITDATAIVEAAGTTQVQTVQAAGTAATAAAQAQIEAKGTAILATIPADYTTMAGKVNEHANAIKGKLSGEIVQAGDVSPVEHYLGVKVLGKNLFNADKIKPTGPFSNYAYITAAGAGAVTIYSNAADNGYCSTGLALRDICPGITAGKVYTLSGTTEAEGRPWMYFLGADITVVYGRSFTATEAMLDSNVVLYGINGKESGAGSCTIFNIQIEEGTEATEYTPYIDPATVTVRRCGKNLLPFPYASAEQTYNGVTFTPNEDGSVTVNGTATGDGISFMLVNTGPGGRQLLPAGTYFMSCPELATADLYMSVFFYEDNETAAFTGTSGKNKAFTLDKPQYYGAYFRIYGGVTVENLTLHPQLERGVAATAYEKYTGTTAMPDESGNVTGLPSAAPTMTLLADTAGVAIECEYNRDSNAVYAELLAKIAALSGTT